MLPAEEQNAGEPAAAEDQASQRRTDLLRSLGLDCCVLGGLCSLGIGLWWERPSLALIVLGTIVFILGARRL